MSCILRISGETLDVDNLLYLHPLLHYSVWKKGESRIYQKGKCCLDSGVQFLVSDADFDKFKVQEQDAIEYLEANLSIIKKIVNFYGVQYSVLDFGVAITDKHFSVSSYLSARLIQLAAKCNLSIEVSCYPCSD
jgi:hypothetical protein